MLEVVEEQQHALVCKMRRQLVRLWDSRLEGEPARLADGRHDVFRFTQRRERHEERAIRKLRDIPDGHFLRDARLPAAAGAKHGDHAHRRIVDETGQCRQFLLPPDERVCAGMLWRRPVDDGVELDAKGVVRPAGGSTLGIGAPSIVCA
jgi:hypothetical protein